MTQRRLAAMGELAAGIAHEINNPLGGLQNAVARLRAGDLEPEREARYFGLLERGLERIGRTVRQLLRFTPRALEHAPVDLLDVANDAADLVRHRAERQGVELALDAATGPGTALCHGARNELGQAVLNLLVNALDALEDGGTRDPSGPRIAIEIGTLADRVELRVADNGPGVAAGEIAKLSDLFYSTKEVGRGSGLGLSLVHNAIRAHGGEVELESLPGRGFTVLIRLPRMAVDAADSAAGSSGEAP
jgi:signal transduction histidine kinase